MAQMIRKQFYIEPGQDAILKQRARSLGVTEAELVRRAIELYVTAPTSPPRCVAAWQKEKAFIASLMSRGKVDGKRRWKRGDLYER